MDNLTSVLLNKNLQRDIEDITHQTNTFDFRSGKEKVIQTNSMPFIKIKISYTGLSYSEMITLRDTFESNAFKVFRCDTDEDIRDELLNQSVMNTFVFDVDSFEFNITPQQGFYKGSLVIISSVIFNTPEYQELQLTQDEYTPSLSTDDDFNGLMTELNPQSVTLKYATTNISSAKGANISIIRPKQLKRIYSLRFVCKGGFFQKLKNFYYKKGNKLGTFGISEDGYINNENLGYNNIKVRFNMDNLSYSTTVDKIYVFNMDFREVL